VARASAPLPPVVAPTPAVAPVPVEREPLAQASASPHIEAPSAFASDVAPLPTPAEVQAVGAVLHSNEDWHALVDRLDIVALTRQLAHQCEWLGSDGGRIRLRLPREMAHLVSSAQDKLRAAVQAALGVPVQLQFEHGAPVSQTVAQRLSAEQQAREQQAREAMRNDPFVQQVIEQFDARLIEDSIKPL
ncbi:MAG: DNA polymerase III subunit gamma/tau C-terminal domain-containing protein, partial [Pseudomonadota bacterium]